MAYTKARRNLKRVNAYTKRGRRVQKPRRSTKKSYTKKRTSNARATGGMTEASKELMVYINPFSSRTQQPRIPDGSRNYSLGYSSRATFSVTGPEHYIYLFPGASCIGYASLTEGGGPIDGKAHKADLSGTWQNMEAWRGVSYGLKLRNVNNSLANDGYWQAIRVQPCDEADILAGPKPAGNNDIVQSLSNSVTPPFANWPNDPTYSTGRLKDIHKASFMLSTENDEHLWCDEAVPMDKSFGIIIVKIVGSATSMIVADFYQNMEMSYRRGSDLNKFMQHTNQVRPNVLTNAQITKRNKCRRAAS